MSSLPWNKLHLSLASKACCVTVQKRELYFLLYLIRIGGWVMEGEIFSVFFTNISETM